MISKPPRVVESAAIRPVGLLCNGSERPLAIGVRPPRFAWRLEAVGGDTAGMPPRQTAYQVRVVRGPDIAAAAEWWDSDRVGSGQNVDVIYDGMPLRGGDKAWWSVRVWDEAGGVSDWAEPVWFEAGPMGRQDFAGAWIGPSQNLFSDPLPAMGDWIAPHREKAPAPVHNSVRDTAEDDTAELRGTLNLPDGYPRCFGMAWVSADPRCTVILNGHELTPGQPFGLDRSITVGLPWNYLQKGGNTLAVRGPVASLEQGVSLLARVHEAESGMHILRSGGDWLCHDAPVVVINDRPAANQPADNGPRRAVDLRRSFTLSKVPAAARMNVTGLGTYEVFINGQRVGDELLAPGWTEFDQRLQFATHDVTPLLKQGENVVEAMLGNGWWSSGMGWESLGKASHPTQTLRFLMDIVEAQAGPNTSPLVRTDGRWSWRPSGILHDTIYHGQKQDLRKNNESWRPVALIDDSFTPRLLPSPSPPIRVTQVLPAKSLTQLPKNIGGGDSGGRWLFDLGQNHAGRPRLRIEVPADTKLTLRHCEELDEQGQPYFENYRTAAVTDVVIAGDGPIDWSPGFTYRGFRYVVLSGVPETVTPDLGTISSEVLHNDVASASTFRCSNELFNEIDQLVRWGLRSNLHSVPTDCPQRDERLGWTGDVQLFARTSCWLGGLQEFYRKWLYDLFDAQCGDGGVTHVAPFLPPVLPRDAAPVWADIITVLPRVLHEFYGDRSMLERAYPPMKRWLAWYEERAVDGLALVGGFGDWVPVEETPAELVGAAFYAYSSQLAAQIAETLGHPHEAERYAAQADAAGAAFHRHFYDADAGCYQPATQTAQLLPLMFDLTPENLRQPVADQLAKLVADRGDKLSTGFVGTAYLLPVLSRFGHHDLAFRVLNTRAFPSLGYMIENGATTVWELWDSDKKGPDMNSRNHFCMGTMAQWMYEDVVGMRPDPARPGFGRVLLSPRPVGDLTFAEFTYQSPQGPIETRWELFDDELVYDLTVPVNMEARLTLPTSDAQATTAEGPWVVRDEAASGDGVVVYDIGPGTTRLRTPRVAAADTAAVAAS